MKKIFFILMFLSGMLNAQKLVILHTNDMHSKLTGFGPEDLYTPLIADNDPTIGGFARLASVIKQEKQKNGDKLLVLDDGDFLMGTLFQTLEPETGFTLRLMKEMGYDAVTFGNHEYDFGAKALYNIVANGEKNGGVPPIIASYIDFPQDCKLRQLSSVKPYLIVKKNGLKIGIFGVLGEDAQADVKFAAPLKFNDPIKVAKKYAKFLRNTEKVDVIICLSHSGVVPDGKGGFVGEDIELAEKVPDIDLIISGHTHVATPHYLQVGKTIIVSTGAYLHNVGRLEVDYKNNKLNVVDFKLIPMTDSIKGDADIQQQILNQEERIDKEVLNQYGFSYLKPVAETSFDLKMMTSSNPKPSVLGNLLPDAMNYYTDQFCGGTDVVITANGVIRENILEGKITVADIYRVSALGFGSKDYAGYPLVRIYITAHELKQLMELTIFSNKPGTDKFLYYSGLKVYYDPDGGFLNKVKKIEIDGKPIDISKKNKQLYSLVTDRYIISFIGNIKKMSYGLIKVIPKYKDGSPVKDVAHDKKILLDENTKEEGVQEAKVWYALAEYLMSFKDVNNDGLPDMPSKYKIYNDIFVKVSKQK